jgi:Tfp pilus assembly protein PilN
MLPFLKKKSEAAEAPAQPAWHPNFRNLEKLPDIKIVRTAFFVNGAAIAVAVAVAIFAGFREWELSVINGQIAQMQAEIARDKAASDRAVAQFKKFQAIEAKINEVDAFLTSKPIVSVLVLQLAKTLPSNIAIDSLDLRDTGLTMRLSIRGDAAAASGYANAYLEQLRNDKAMSQFDEFKFTGSPVRNPSTGRMAVEFMLRLKPPVVAKKKS